jgi:hypothetical protein
MPVRQNGQLPRGQVTPSFSAFSANRPLAAGVKQDFPAVRFQIETQPCSLPIVSQADVFSANDVITICFPTLSFFYAVLSAYAIYTPHI